MTNKIKEETSYYVSTFENIETVITKKKKDIDAKFTSFGHRAACRAIYHIIESLDEETQNKILDIMKNTTLNKFFKK